MISPRKWIICHSLTLASFALCAMGLTATAQDHCAAPGPNFSCTPQYSYSCAPRVSRAPAQAPAAPQQMTVQRAVMQQETVMVPMTVMMPQVVYRQRIINELVQAPPAAAPAAPFIPPAPAAELPAAAPPAAPQMSMTRDCAGSPSTQMALVAAMMMNNRTQSSARAQAAPSPELRERVTRLESKLDKLIVALEKKQ